MSAPTLLCEWSQPADWVLASCQGLQSNENVRALACKCIQNTKGKACSLGNHRLLYKEACVISAYLGWWTRERLRARKIPFWHTHTHTHAHFFLAVFKKTIFVLWQYEQALLCCSGSDRVPSGSSNSSEVKQYVLGLFFLPWFIAVCAWGRGVTRREMPPGFNSCNLLRYSPPPNCF